MRSFITAAVLATALLVATARAAPAHDVCADLGGGLAVGVSSYSAAEGWPEKAAAAGVTWRLLYFYVFPSQTPVADMTSFIALKATLAKQLGTTLVITFYDLLKRGQSAGFVQRTGSTNAEADIVAQTLASTTQMRGYFDGYIAVLKAALGGGATTLVHVEPDSWGFMMWAMGVEGRSDPTTVPVKVVASGHPDLTGQAFSDDASGFGRALLFLRDKYAPAVRLAWHASNFRAGARPEVVTAFYAGVGAWDAIVTEDPHIVGDAQNWWQPLDATAVDTNVQWFQAVSSAAGVPILMWQIPLGPIDYHWFGETGGRDVLGRFMAAGLGGMMWEVVGSSGDADGFRADGLATPPAGSAADGTAKDLRTRLAQYQTHPLPWPAGSPCAAHTDAGAGANGSGGSSGGGGSSGAQGGSTGTGQDGTGGTTTGRTSSGACSCRVGGRPPTATLLVLGVALLRRRRR